MKQEPLAHWNDAICDLLGSIGKTGLEMALLNEESHDEPTASDHEWLGHFRSFMSPHQDLDTRLKHNNTALHVAARKGYLSVVKALISRDANVSLTNDFGETPLDVAMHYGHSNVVQFIRANISKDQYESA